MILERRWERRELFECFIWLPSLRFPRVRVCSALIISWLLSFGHSGAMSAGHMVRLFSPTLVRCTGLVVDSLQALSHDWMHGSAAVQLNVGISRC